LFSEGKNLKKERRGRLAKRRGRVARELAERQQDEALQVEMRRVVAIQLANAGEMNESLEWAKRCGKENEWKGILWSSYIGESYMTAS